MTARVFSSLVYCCSNITNNFMITPRRNDELSTITEVSCWPAENGMTDTVRDVHTLQEDVGLNGPTDHRIKSSRQIKQGQHSRSPESSARRISDMTFSMAVSEDER